MSTSRSSDYLAALLVGLWFLAACAFLYLWPSFKFGQPVWQVGDHQTVPPLLLSLVPLVVFGAVALTYKRPDRVSFWTMVLLNGTLYGLIFLYLFEVRSSFSRFVLPITFVLSVVVQIFGLFIFKFIRGRWIGVLVATSTIFSLTMVFVVLTNPLDILGKSFKILNGGYDALRISLRNAQSSEKTEQYLNTAFYHVRADVFQKYIPESAVRGGGMLSLDEGVLLVTGDGKFYLIRRNGGFQELDVEALVIEVPLNYEAFVNDAPITVYHKWFRVAGIHYEKTPAGIRLWVSHHYWKVEEQKFYVRLSTIEGTLAKLLDGKPSSDWKTLFESTPGLTFNENSRHGNPFNGSQIGGRIQTLDEKYLLLTMGDHEWDGWNSEFSYPQDLKVSYGKILKINKETGASEIFSAGHRNPQGLIITSDRTIWSTEHGPAGGDELNLILEGKNYGWPLAVLGTDYQEKVWPPSILQGKHDGYEYPVFAWNPSIGISNLVQINSELFPVWKENLLIASMEQQSLYRAHVEDGRVVVVVPIEIGNRVRDIIEDRDGQIFLWTDEGNVIVLNPILDTEKTGEMIFAQCMACHTFDESGKQSIGPNLIRLYGRSIGNTANYQYSPAFQKLEGRWFEEALDAFLKNPQQFAPGTTMAVPGMNDTDRKKVIDYLQGK